MKKLFNLLTISAFAASGLLAQSEAQYTHFMFNKLGYNAAWAGSKRAPDFTGIYRKQWAGLDGAPQTMNFNASAPFAGGRNALGFSVLADQIGKVNTTAVDIFYAYHLELGSAGRLSLGLQGRIEQVKIKWSQADPLDLGDAAIPDVDEVAFAPNFGAGMLWHGEKLFAGLSSPRFLRNALYRDLGTDDPGLRSSVRTWYFMAGGAVRVGSQARLLPSILVSHNPNAPLDVDLNASLRFLDAFWVGASYRLGDSFDGLAGFEFKNGLRLGLALDFTASELEKATSGSGELMLGYTFRCKSCEVSHLRFF